MAKLQVFALLIVGAAAACDPDLEPLNADVDEAEHARDREVLHERSHARRFRTFAASFA